MLPLFFPLVGKKEKTGSLEKGEQFSGKIANIKSAAAAVFLPSAASSSPHFIGKCTLFDPFQSHSSFVKSIDMSEIDRLPRVFHFSFFFHMVLEKLKTFVVCLLLRNCTGHCKFWQLSRARQSDICLVDATHLSCFRTSMDVCSIQGWDWLTTLSVNWLKAISLLPLLLLPRLAPQLDVYIELNAMRQQVRAQQLTYKQATGPVSLSATSWSMHCLSLFSSQIIRLSFFQNKINFLFAPLP